MKKQVWFGGIAGLLSVAGFFWAREVVSWRPVTLAETGACVAWPAVNYTDTRCLMWRIAPHGGYARLDDGDGGGIHVLRFSDGAEISPTQKEAVAAFSHDKITFHQGKTAFFDAIRRTWRPLQSFPLAAAKEFSDDSPYNIWKRTPDHRVRLIFKKKLWEWSTESGKLLARRPLGSADKTNWTFSLWDEQGKHFACSTTDGVGIGDALSGRIDRLPGIDHFWQPVSFCHGIMRCCLPASEDGSLDEQAIFDVATRRLLWNPAPFSMISESGKFVMLVTPKGCEIRDARSGKLLRRLPGLTDQAADLIFTPDNSHIWSIESSGKVRSWRVS